MESKRKKSRFYDSIALRYVQEAERFVPNYQEMVREVTSIIYCYEARMILDLGCGVGNIAELLVEKYPGIQVACVDSSQKMVAATESRLRKYQSSNVFEIVKSNISDFQPKKRFDCVFSSLVLHNLSPKEKILVLKKIKSRWLTPNGIFIWADLIRHGVKKVQTYFVEFRKQFAAQQGADPKLIALNFTKESRRDYPLTLSESEALLEETGFDTRELIWKKTTFAVFFAQ